MLWIRRPFSTLPGIVLQTRFTFDVFDSHIKDPSPFGWQRLKNKNGTNATRYRHAILANLAVCYRFLGMKIKLALL